MEKEYKDFEKINIGNTGEIHLCKDEEEIEEYKFNFAYSDFAQDQIITEKYAENANDILNLAQDDEIKEKMEKILYDGGYDDFTVNLRTQYKNNPSLEGETRQMYASLLATDKNTFDIIEKNNIKLFHGTNSNALPSILKEGMNSESEIIKKGQEITTGENFGKEVKPRAFISFTNQFATSLEYAANKPSSNAKDKNSFGVLIGLSSNIVENSRSPISYSPISSDISEIGIMKHVPKEYINLIAVPEKHIDEVQQMIEENNLENINLVSIEGFIQARNLAYKPYSFRRHIDSESMEITGTSEKVKNFGQTDFKEIAETRKVSKIKQLFQKFKNVFKSKENEKGENHGVTRD